MKTLTKLALALAILSAAAPAHADWVRGHFRSPGTYVMPYYRTPANGIPYDNLSYRGYPSQQPGYVSPRTYDFGTQLTRPVPMPNYDSYKFNPRLLPSIGNYAPKPLLRAPTSKPWRF